MKSTQRLLCHMLDSDNLGVHKPTPAPSENALVQARARLSSEVALCSQKYNYDPNTIVGKPQMALAPNELSWRQCAYEAVRDNQKANPELAPPKGAAMSCTTIVAYFTRCKLSLQG